MATLGNTYFQSGQQHQTNMATALAHRIAVAQANGDRSLLTLLEQERQQLAAWQQPSPRQSWIYALQQWFKGRSRLQVEQAQDARGNYWWYAHDPNTGKTLYAESAGEVVNWIEQNRLGV